MLRRLGGLVVITAACLVLGVTAAVNSLTVSGTATLPAGAIVPGTCIGPVGSPFEHPVSPGAGEGEQLWETATYAYPEPTVVDCRRSHAGQVISVDHGVDAPSAGTMPQFDDLDAACQQQVDALMAARGLSQIVDRRVSGTIAWKPVLDVQGRTVGPDRRARSVGERWSACAEVSSTGALGAAEDPLPGACLDSDDPAALAAFGTDDFAERRRQLFGTAHGAGPGCRRDGRRVAQQRGRRKFVPGRSHRLHRALRVGLRRSARPRGGRRDLSVLRGPDDGRRSARGIAVGPRWRSSAVGRLRAGRRWRTCGG